MAEVQLEATPLCPTRHHPDLKALSFVRTEEVLVGLEAPIDRTSTLLRRPGVDTPLFEMCLSRARSTAGRLLYLFYFTGL